MANCVKAINTMIDCVRAFNTTVDCVRVINIAVDCVDDGKKCFERNLFGCSNNF